MIDERRIMKTKRERLIILLPLLLSLALVVGIVLGNWITGIRIRNIVTDEVNKQKFSIRPGHNSGSGFSLSPLTGTKMSTEATIANVAKRMSSIASGTKWDKYPPRKDIKKMGIPI